MVKTMTNVSIEFLETPRQGCGWDFTFKFVFLETVYGFNQEIRGAGGIYFFICLFLEYVYGFNQKIRGAGGNFFLQKRSFHTNIHTAGPSTIEAIWCGLSADYFTL
jgi:hypothetical protein